MSDLLVVKPTYLADANWLSGGGADPGINYCRSCADKEQQKFGDRCVVDGGWPTEHDAPPQCEICHEPLAATLMDGTEIETADEWHKWCQEND